MKTVTNIVISHGIFLAVFAFAAYALAQEDNTLPVPLPAEQSAKFKEQADTRRAEMEALQATQQEAVSNRQAEMEAKQIEQNDAAISRQAEMEAKKAEMEGKVAEQQETRITEQADRQAKMEDRQAELQDKVANRQSDMEEKRLEMQANMTERRAQLQEITQQRITNLAANMSNRMDSAIVRLQDIIDRLDSRIQKLEAAGIDTSAAKAALASSQLSVDAALAEIATIDTTVVSAISSEDARADWSTAKTKFVTIRDYLKTAHAELKASVAALKEAAVAANLNSGTSAAVRNDNAVEVTN